MKIGCAALYPITRYGFPYSFDNYMKAVREMQSAGFKYCELEINVDNDLEEYFQRIDDVKSILGETQMTISSIIGVVNGAFSMDKALAERTMIRFERLCQFANHTGCKNVCICAYMPPEIEGVKGTEAYAGSPPQQVRVPKGFDWDRFWDNAVQRFGQMARLANNY